MIWVLAIGVFLGGVALACDTWPGAESFLNLWIGGGALVLVGALAVYRAGLDVYHRYELRRLGARTAPRGAVRVFDVERRDPHA